MRSSKITTTNATPRINSRLPLRAFVFSDPALRFMVLGRPNHIADYDRLLKH
jgi:hypothetical protein